MKKSLRIMCFFGCEMSRKLSTLLHGVSAKPDDLISNNEFKAMLEKEITEHLRKSFGGYEVPKKFVFIKDYFSVDNGMLTQTLKLKRRVVIHNYQKEIEALYAKNN